MIRKQKKAYKKLKKHYKKHIESWEKWLTHIEEYRIPYFQEEQRKYHILLKNKKEILDYLSEYYGYLAELEYKRKQMEKEEERRISFIGLR